MKKVKNKLNLNKKVLTQLNQINGGVAAATYTCTAGQPSATTCAYQTCNAGTCAASCGLPAGYNTSRGDYDIIACDATSYKPLCPNYLTN